MAAGTSTNDIDLGSLKKLDNDKLNIAADYYDYYDFTNIKDTNKIKYVMPMSS